MRESAKEPLPPATLGHGHQPKATLLGSKCHGEEKRLAQGVAELGSSSSPSPVTLCPQLWSLAKEGGSIQEVASLAPRESNSRWNSLSSKHSSPSGSDLKVGLDGQKRL